MRLDAEAELKRRLDRLARSAFPYVLGTRLGIGGMGAVFRAHRRGERTEVALKFMLPNVADDDLMRQTFLREIDSMAHLSHPRIVKFLQWGQVADTVYVAMELCRGGSLDRFVAQSGGKLLLPNALTLMEDALEAMAFVHEAGFVHRDLKPANLLLDDGGRCKIGDLGLAKSFETAGFSGITDTGYWSGTPEYMACEQVTNFKRVGPPTDVWSMAAIFYELLTGMHPRQTVPGGDPIRTVMEGQCIPLGTCNRSIPSAVASVVDQALAPRPTARYPHARAFREALAAAMSKGV